MQVFYIAEPGPLLPLHFNLIWLHSLAIAEHARNRVFSCELSVSDSRVGGVSVEPRFYTHTHTHHHCIKKKAFKLLLGQILFAKSFFFLGARSAAAEAILAGW